MKMNGQSFSREIGFELNGPFLRHSKAKWSVKDLNNSLKGIFIKCKPKRLVR
jgi:hypothetical protein